MNKKESVSFNSKPFLSKEGAGKLRAGDTKRRTYAAKTLKKLDKVIPYATEKTLQMRLK